MIPEFRRKRNSRTIKSSICRIVIRAERPADTVFGAVRTVWLDKEMTSTRASQYYSNSSVTSEGRTTHSSSLDPLLDPLPGLQQGGLPISG